MKRELYGFYFAVLASATLAQSQYSILILIPIAAALLVAQIMYSPADPYTKRKDFFRRSLIGTYSMMDMAGRFGFNLVVCFVVYIASHYFDRQIAPLFSS